jgi:hypothetical protein
MPRGALSAQVRLVGAAATSARRPNLLFCEMADFILQHGDLIPVALPGIAFAIWAALLLDADLRRRRKARRMRAWLRSRV